MVNLWMLLRYSIWIALGGAIGAVIRFWCAEFIHLFIERGFPVGTLFVNVVGSFLMGFFAVCLFDKFSFNNELRSFLLIGVLGGFTTFSTFSLDVINLLNSGNIWFAVLNIILSVSLCVLAAGLGVWMA